MAKDYFEKWLNKNKGHHALVSKSYRNFHLKENRAPYEGKINEELDTYGDAVLKLAICTILYEDGVNIEKMTETKKRYESDATLVKVIARHYRLIDYISFDRNNPNIPKNYDYKDDTYKYIATALEAALAAIYIEEKHDIKKILGTVRFWMSLVDRAEK